MSRLAAEYQDEGLPSLGLIYNYLKSVQSDKRTDTGLIMQLFTVNGHRYVRGEKDGDSRQYHVMNVDPANAPSLPHGASDEHIVIPRELQAKDDLQDYSQQITELTGIAAEIPF